MPAFTFPFPANGKVFVKNGVSVSPETLLVEAELYLSFSHLPLASLLGVRPNIAATFLLKEVGSDALSGERIALKKGRLLARSKEVFSPVTGRLVSLDSEKGELTIGSDPISFRLVSPGKGKVTNLTGSEMTIDFSGREIPLVEGGGPVVFGELAVLGEKAIDTDPSLLNESQRGKILLSGTWGGVALAKAAAIGVKGLIGSNLSVSFEEAKRQHFRFGDLSFTFAFSMGRISDADFALLKEFSTRQVILFGEGKRICLLD